MADTKADTKRYDSDASVDSVAIEIIADSSRVRWSGCPLTPVTRVRTPLELPITKGSQRPGCLFSTPYISDLDNSTTVQYHVIYEPEAAQNTDRNF